jgi:molecular chaperone DnaK (HSP70)
LIGIDWGTTNSSVAVLDPFTNQVEMRRVDAGEKPNIIRSILSKDFDGNWIIGNQAAAVGPWRDRSVFSLKTELRRDLQFSLTIDGERYGLADLISIFFRELLRKAGIDEPRQIERLCLSIPVNFDEERKSVMESAVVKLGIPADRVWFLDEPVAVLWDCRNLRGEYALVFDFGGGTLDMAVLDKYGTEERRPSSETNRNQGNVLAKAGLDIGGDDMDDVIIRCFIEQGKLQGNPVCESISLDVFDDPARLYKLKTHPKFTFYYQLKTLAEETKWRISGGEPYTLNVPPLIPGIDQGIRDITFAPEQFILRTEALRNRMLQGLKQLNDRLYENARLTRRQIDAVLLSGGSSLVPFVPDLLEELYPNARIVWDEEHLQTRIARGNARYARNEEEMIIGDTVNAAYGIYSHAGKETIVVIEPNEPYPVRKQKRVATTKPNQSRIEIIPMVKKANQPAFEPLKKNGVKVAWKMNIRPHPQTMDLNRITVTYTIDKSQRLRVSAYDHVYLTEIGVEEIPLDETAEGKRNGYS